MKWVKEHRLSNEADALLICKNLLDNAMITRIDNGGSCFEPTNQCMLKFYEDRDDIAANMLRPWKGEVGEPLSVSS